MIYVFGFDESFAMPTGVALRSLDRFLGSGDQVLLLHDGVSAGALGDVRACALQADITSIDCRSMFEPVWRSPAHVTRAAYLRFLAPALLAGEPRCVYLDGDVVVRRDPAPLHQHHLAGATLGAVRSRVAPFAASPGGIMQWLELGIRSTAPYFNSGVYVVDLKRWRDRDITGRVTEFLAEHGDFTFIADQEALNVAVVGDWVELDRTWNYVTHVAESFLQQPELEPHDPSIVHFAGRLKPWAHGRQPLFAEEWHGLLSGTPWAGFTPTPPLPATGPRAWLRTRAGHAVRALRDIARDG